ncbi:MAG: VWA domain-containing protein [Campylobacterales bacterium]|nr:VWA domain-containing protein [Campylobacterales bacterium]
MFSFEYPWALILILVFIACDKWCKEQSEAIFFPHVSLLLLNGKNRTPILHILKWIGVSSAIIALASPVVSTDQYFEKKHDMDMVLILDASDSMKDTKFDKAKQEMDAFISKRTSNNIGLVTFGDNALIASPITADIEILKSIVKSQELGMAGHMSAINDAITKSYGMLSRSKSKTKMVILLTGSIDNKSNIHKDDLLSLISKFPIKFYAIGYGNGYDAFYLHELAKAGRGMAYEAVDTSELSKIYNEIDRREGAAFNEEENYIYLYLYPLFVAWLSLLIWIYIRNIKGM